MSIVSDNPSPAEAEAGAEEARATLVGTLNQLRENLKPANVAGEVMTNAKAGAAVMNEQLWDAARKNPLPALMIGAGVAMLLGVGGRKAVSGARLPRAATLDPFLTGGAVGSPQPDDPTRPAAGTRARRWTSAKVGPAQDRGADLLEAANTRLSDVTSRGAGAITSALSSSTSAGDPMTSPSYATRQARGTLSRLVDDQPLVLAALGVAIGAAIGAAIPQTDTENRLMGDASHSVRDAAQDVAQQQVGQIRAAAQHAVEDIKQTVSDHGLNADNLSGLAHDVGEKAKSAANEAGQGLGKTS